MLMASIVGWFSSLVALWDVSRRSKGTIRASETSTWTGALRSRSFNIFVNCYWVATHVLRTNWSASSSSRCRISVGFKGSEVVRSCSSGSGNSGVTAGKCAAFCSKGLRTRESFLEQVWGLLVDEFLDVFYSVDDDPGIVLDEIIFIGAILGRETKWRTKSRNGALCAVFEASFRGIRRVRADNNGFEWMVKLGNPV